MVEAAQGAISSESVAQSQTAMMPEQAIIVNEAVTFVRAFVGATQGAVHHDWLTVTVVALVGGMPSPTGSAILITGYEGTGTLGSGIGVYGVPEPSRALLAFAGLFGLFLRRRR